MALQIASTGESIIEETTPYTMRRWQSRTERRLLRYKRTPERVKAAIRSGDTIVGWVNFDAMRRAGCPGDVVAAETQRVFKGYEHFYELRGQRYQAAEKESENALIPTYGSMDAEQAFSVH